MVVGCAAQDEDRTPIRVGDGEIKCVNAFMYLGSLPKPYKTQQVPVYSGKH